jgi:hypothetical protein
MGAILTEQRAVGEALWLLLVASSTAGAAHANDLKPFFAVLFSAVSGMAKS